MPKEVWKPANLLAPTPVIMASAGRPGETPNIITLAWAGTVCSDPPMLSVSIRPERYSYPLIRETGEFVVNLVTEELTRAADFCGVRSGRDLNKFEAAGLTPEPSVKIAAPAIAESPVNLECRVTQVIPLGSHDLFLAEILAVRVDARLINEKGKLDLTKAGLIAYSHGDYQKLSDIVGSFGFSVRRKRRT